MTRPLIAAAVLLASSALFASSAFSAGTAPAQPTKTAKPAAKKAAPKAAEPTVESTPDDNLSAGQLAMADRVLTGTAECEFKQSVKIERLEGHNGNFKLTFDKHAYIVQPKETTTGAVLLVDKADTVEWVQIPKKSMLMNQKEHHRMVDNCQADAQRVAVQSDPSTGAH
jgi:hypothetical protein